MLFYLTEGADKLKVEKAVKFHLKLAKILWSMNRSQPYIQTSISFLFSWVKDLYIHDWGKLRRVLKSMNQNIGYNWGLQYLWRVNLRGRFIHHTQRHKRSYWWLNDVCLGVNTCKIIQTEVKHKNINRVWSRRSQRLHPIWYMVGYVYGTRRVYKQTKITHVG